jgi:hypothetical protein
MAAAVDEEFSFSDLAPDAATVSSSSFHHIQSPRVVQGCVATFLQLFEWYPGCKRISSASGFPLSLSSLPPINSAL